jgi:hypothetical protein
MPVENVRVNFIRPKGFQNLKEWMKEPNNIYIGRGGIVFIDGERFPRSNSLFCNPYKLNIDGSREEIIEKYRKYITKKIETEPKFKQELLKLKDKNLGCWCHPEFCHGDILLELIETYSS